MKTIINENCKKCRYHYLDKVELAKTVYSALDDRYTTLTAEHNQSHCGFSVPGVEISASRPACKEFIKLKETKN